MCPGCGGRAAKLYRPTPPDSFLCRRCHGLVYRSQQTHDKGLDRFRHLDHDGRLQALNSLPLPDVPAGWEPRGWRDAVKMLKASSRFLRFYERVLSLCDG